MKSKLFLILLFVSGIAFSQTWNQVGLAEFTDFASNGEMAFDSTGVPYLLYENSTTNQVSVMKFNGTSWLPVGSGAISTENYNNITIKINPVTNQPWVALKAEASGAASNIDVFSFDGSSWISEGANIGGSFYSYGIQLQFSTAGVPRIVGMIASVVPSYKPSFYTKNGANWSVTTYPTYTGAPRGVNARIDFYDFDHYTMAQQSSVKNYNVSDNNQTAHETLLYTGGVNYRQVSANGGAKYFAVIDAGTSKKITVGKSGGGVTQPSGVTGVTEEIVAFRESITDNQQYLMYSDGSYNLTFKKYKTSNTWVTLTSIGILTNTAGFFVKMEMNPVNGDMYVAYLDGGKVSVKRFSIRAPLTKYYVNTNVVGGDRSGDSWVNAMPNLEDALSSASPITTDIWVAAGTYSPGTSRSDSFSFNQDNLEVYGGFLGTETSISQRNIATNPTILSGDVNGDDAVVDFATASGSSRIDNNHQVVKISANNVTIDGFKIEDGDAVQNSTGYTQGAAILVDPTALNLKLQNCEFNNNVTYSGGAIALRHTVSTDFTITNCKFNNNVSRYGSGLYVLIMSNINLNVIITNTLFINNTSKNYYSANDGYTGSAAWIRANTAGSSLTTTITNCTFASNTDIGTQSGVAERGSLSLVRRTDGNSTHNATVNNSVFYGNKGAGNTVTPDVNRGHVTFPNQMIVNNSIGELGFSNLNAADLTNTSNLDPLFVDASTNDFTLQSASPAIDNGDNSKIPSGVITDLSGNIRVANANVDMGPYEEGCTASCFVLTLNIIGNGSVENGGVNVASVASYAANTSLSLMPVNVLGNQFLEWSGDASGNSVPLAITMDSDKTINVTFIEVPLFVDKDATGANNGSSWTDAFTDLNSAIQASTSNTLGIWVADGIYKPGAARTDAFSITTDNLKIYGGFNGTESSIIERDVVANPTILSGDVNSNDAVVDFATASGSSRIDNNHQVVKISANNVTIDGFKIEDGDAVQNTTGYTQGAAILVDPTALNLKLQNCEFNNNVTYSGGAIALRHTVSTDFTITNCKFNNNVSRYGSGLYVLIMSNINLNVIITNTLFINNTSKNYYSDNDGYTGSAAWIRANTAGSSLTTTITNCTFANNTDIGTKSGVAERGTLSLGRRTDGSSTHNATVNNCIIYNNIGASNVTTLDINKGHVSFPNQLLVNNSIGEQGFSNLSAGNLTNTSNSDPLFVDASNNDFTLQTGSPAIDAGDSSLVSSNVLTDLSGNTRIQNIIVDMGCYESVSLAIKLDIDMFLQGAAINPNVGEETLMRDDLRLAGIIPTTSPYSDGLICNASVFAVTGADAIVDWIWVGLRDANDNTNVIEAKSALLQRDGDAVSVDGVSSLEFSQPTANYYVVVNHRNHLGAMSLNTIALSATSTTVDFTNGITTFGTNAQKDMGSGIMGLWTGDANGDNNLNYIGALSETTAISSHVFNDPNNTIFGGPPVATYSSLGYSNADVNMDGITKYIGTSSDVSFISDNIFNNPSNTLFGGPPTATYVFSEQLP